MGSEIEGQIEKLVNTLEKTLGELEELLDTLSEQREQVLPKLDALARDQGETRGGLQELREAIEDLNQKIDRIATLRS
ncbi:MAG: hypothetical protein AB1792_04240 [Candidatus Zixiibacteriota bacterium]